MKIAEPKMVPNMEIEIESIRKQWPASLSFYIVHFFLLACALLTLERTASKVFVVLIILVLADATYREVIRGYYLDATFTLSPLTELLGAPRTATCTGMMIYQTGTHNTKPATHDLRILIPLKGVDTEGEVIMGESRSSFNVAKWAIRKDRLVVYADCGHNRVGFTLRELALLSANQVGDINGMLCMAGTQLAEGLSSRAEGMIDSCARFIASNSGNPEIRDAANKILKYVS